MDIYLAGEHPVKNGKLCAGWQGISILETYYYLRKNELAKKYIKNAGKFLLDSGAFTFMSSNNHNSIDWIKYADEYAEFINAFDIKHYFELDIDSIVGYENVKKLRQRIEQRTGRQSIPVWHKSRGKEEFIGMCKDYNYVAIGGLVKGSDDVPDDYMPWFINTAHKHNAKIHGLGFTRVSKLPICKFDSVDSTAWLAGNRGGFLYKFDASTGKFKQIKKAGCRLKSNESALHNFKEWIKFQQYAKIYL